MKRLLRLFLVLLALVAAIAGGGYLYLLRSLPLTEGEVTVVGVESPVEILRDTYGIPHIFARSNTNATFALGFAHAQDRLGQIGGRGCWEANRDDSGIDGARNARHCP